MRVIYITQSDKGESFVAKVSCDQVPRRGEQIEFHGELSFKAKTPCWTDGGASDVKIALVSSHGGSYSAEELTKGPFQPVGTYR